MTTAERLQSIQASKEAIKAAIEAKGVECNDVLSTFAENIAAIPTGGGSSEFSEYSYRVPTADEEGLRALGWDDESINYYQYNNLDYSANADCYKVSEANIKLVGKITVGGFMKPSFYKDSLRFCPSVDTSAATSLQAFFSGCSYLEGLPILNTSNVTTMDQLFSSCSWLTVLPPMDTSKVTNMYAMFKDCSKALKLPLYNTANVVRMDWMFYRASRLRTIPKFDTHKVTTMAKMFYMCSELIRLATLDMSAVDDATDMLYGCNQLEELGGFTGLKTDLSLSSSRPTHDSLMNVINEAADVTASPKTLTLGSTNLAKLTDEEKAIATGKGWTLA